MVKGIYSAFIRQKVIEAVPTTYEALKTSILQSVAIALECYRMDTGNVGSWTDYLPQQCLPMMQEMCRWTSQTSQKLSATTVGRALGLALGIFGFGGYS